MTRPPTSARIAALWNAPLSAEDFEHRLAQAFAELDGDEGVEIRSLIAWFRRRYPTARARLAYANRKTREMAEGPRIRGGD